MPLIKFGHGSQLHSYLTFKYTGIIQVYLSEGDGGVDQRDTIHHWKRKPCVPIPWKKLVIIQYSCLLTFRISGKPV